MITVFSKITEFNVLPKKRNLVGVIILATVLSLIYILIAFLYLINFSNCVSNHTNSILVCISIFEISLTGLSIVISLWATYISDYISRSCLNIIEHINKSNEPISKEQAIVKLSAKAKKLLKVAFWLKVVLGVTFALYFISLVAYNTVFNDSISSILSIVFGSISTIITIILAVISSISSFVSGKHSQLLLNVLYQDNIRLSDKYNELKITYSHEKQL